LRRHAGALVRRSKTATALYRIGLQALHALAAPVDIEARLGALLDRTGARDRAGAIPGRILLVGHGLAAGGAERQTLNTMIGLDRLVRAGDFESVRLALDPLPEDGSRSFYLPHLRAAGFGYHEIALRPEAAAADLEALRPELTQTIGADCAQKVIAYAAFFRETRPEVAHLWQDWINVLAGLGAVFAGVPGVLLSGRNLSPPHFLYSHPMLRPAYRALLARQRTSLLNNSQAGAADYARWLGIAPDGVGVIRNGVVLARRDARAQAAAMDLRRALGIPDGAPVVCSVFRFWPEKRPELWLRTAIRIAAARPEAHFLIAGWGPLIAKTRAAAARAGLGGRFVIAEAQQDVAAAICAGDVFLLTSRAEGIPNVVLEAQYLGVPVVATDAGGTAETIFAGATGAISSERPAELARHVLAWLADEPGRLVVRETGPRWIEERFGFDRMVAETVAAYDRVRGRSR
jgi:glycosyltransferase involved in cell wall biosynthesis